MTKEPLYHIYLEDKCLFKNFNQKEFELIWDKIYRSYFKEDLTYVECIDDACIQGKVRTFLLVKYKAIIKLVNT